MNQPTKATGAPRVSPTDDGHILLIPPVELFTDELLVAVLVWAQEVREREDTQYNRPAADLTEHDNRVLAAAGVVRDLLTVVMTPDQVHNFLPVLREKAIGAQRARIDRHSADCPVCKHQRDAS